MPTAVADPELMIDEIIPAAEIEKLELGRTAEILQPLRDLGYINTADEAALFSGMRLFRRDYLALNLIPEYTPKFLLIPNTPVESEELNLLHTLTAVDGDYTIEILPEIGQTNLISRLIHYRLMIHELFDEAIDSPFSEKALKAINHPKEWIDNLPATDLEMVNLLGNIPALLQHIANDKNGKLHKKIVVFKFQTGPSSISRFAAPPPSAAMLEVMEETDEADPADKTEATRLENEMLRLETSIDKEIEDLKSKINFDPNEQEVLNRDAKKNKKKHLKVEQVQAMMKKTHGEMVELNDRFNATSIELKATFDSLNKIKIDLENKQRFLTKSIDLKKGILQQQKSIHSDISKKQKRIQELKGKPNNKRRRKKIAKLLEELQKLQQQKLTPTQVQKIEFEISDFKVKLAIADAELNPIKREVAKSQKAFDRHLNNQDSLLSTQQKEMLKLQADLKNLELKVNKLKFSFRNRMRRSLDDDFYNDVVRKKIFQQRSRNTLQAFSEDAYNNYLIRLIQVFQWTNGYYYGKLDSEIGDRTFSALDDMSDYTRKLRLKFILSKLSDAHDGSRGFWILNIKYLFDHLSDIIAEHSEEVTTRELLEKYEEEFQGTDEHKNKIGNEAMDRGYKEIVEENEEDLREHGMIRRIYYGIRSIARTLIKALSDIIQILKRGIQRLIYLVKNLVKIVYKEIREGVRKFKAGMHFLFGHRIIQTITENQSAIYTKFDFDFDAMSYIPDQTTKLEKINHIQKLQQASANLDFSLVLTARVLKWTFRIIEAGTPLGWARLAIRIAIQYKKLMIQWLVRLGKFFAKQFIQVKYRVAKQIP